MAAAVVHHQLLVDEDEGAVVGTSAEGVQAAGRDGDLAAPEDAERLAQRVVGRNQQVIAHDGRVALPLTVGEVVANQTLISQPEGIERIATYHLVAEPGTGPCQPQASRRVTRMELDPQRMEAGRQCRVQRAAAALRQVQTLLPANLQTGRLAFRCQPEAVVAELRHQQRAFPERKIG